MTTEMIEKLEKAIQCASLQAMERIEKMSEKYVRKMSSCKIPLANGGVHRECKIVIPHALSHDYPDGQHFEIQLRGRDLLLKPTEKGKR